MADTANMFLIVTWDTAQMASAEVEEHMDAFSDVLRRLASADNWDKPISEVFGKASR